MRFVFTAPRFHTNQRYAFKALLDAGHEVTALVLRRGQSEAYDVLEPRVLGCSRLFDSFRKLVGALPRDACSDVGSIPSVLTLWYEVRRLRPDAVVVRNPYSAYGVLAMVAGRCAGARLILYVQISRHREVRKSSRVKRAVLLWLTRATWFTPVRGDPDRFPTPYYAPRYIPFVMQPQTSPGQRGWFANGCVNLLHIGKFQPRKNHRMFLEAIAKLTQRYPLRATIVGECSSPEQRLEWEEVGRLRAQLGLDEVVQIETNVPHLEMDRLYASHDLFVLASRDEPAAVSHLEAMAHSLPVVCSDGNGTSCYVRHGENGFIFSSNDGEDLEVCIESVIRDRQRLVEMGSRSYELVLREHKPRLYVDALVEMASGRR